MSWALSVATRGYLCRLARLTQAVQQIPLAPSDAQALLVKALELPLPESMTNSKGIFQPDIIIRTGIIAGLADLRANPKLLDYAFASLPKDDLTCRDYGEQAVYQAKQWFLATHIPVFMDYKFDRTRIPCISVTLRDSVETHRTVGEIHYDPYESDENTWEPICQPFTPKEYDPLTGTVTLSPSFASSIIVSPGWYIVDNFQIAHEILEVPTYDTFVLAEGTVADFRNSVLKGPRPSHETMMLSSVFKETYQLSCFVGSDPVHLTYLYSVLVFSLLRYRAALFEARGFFQSAIVSADFKTIPVSAKERVYSRNVTLTGFVRNYWPGVTSPVLDAFNLKPQAGIASEGEAVVATEDSVVFGDE